MQAKVIFICSSQKKVVSLPSKVQRRGLEGGRCPLSESQMLTQRPQSRLSRHIKRRLLRFVLTGRNLANFELKNQDLATIDVLGMCISCTRVPFIWVYARICTYRRGLRVVVLSGKAMREPHRVERQQSDSTLFFICLFT